MKRIAILGEIGSGNLGDDLGYTLLRDELIRLFEEEHDVLVDIRPLTPNLHDMLRGYHWDAVVLGCGTLLDYCNGPYVRTLRSLLDKAPVLVLGSGMSDPNHLPPTDEGRQALHDVLGKAVYVWIRGDGAGPTYAGPDSAWLMGQRILEHHEEAIAKTERDTLGVNVGYAAYSQYGVDRIVTAIKGFRNYTQGRQQLIAAWENDKRFLAAVSATDPVHTVDGRMVNFEPLLGMHTIFATRIHLAVMAACCGVHPVVFDYSTKVRDVFYDVAIPKTILDPVQKELGSDQFWRYLAKVVEPEEEKNQGAGYGSLSHARAKCVERVREGVNRLCMRWGL